MTIKQDVYTRITAKIIADLGITPETREDHSAYIAFWLKVLRQDKRAIFTAASHAQRAADHLHQYQEASILPSREVCHA